MKEASVAGTLVAGCSLSEYPRGLAFAEAHPNVWYSVGVHPSTDDDPHEPDVDTLVELAKPEKVVAIGECGLDYFYEKPPYDNQKNRFAIQIEAAKVAKLPVIVHSRDAQKDTMDILKSHGADECGFVLHCFTGDREMAKAALDLGGYISFSGIVTFKNAEQIREAAAFVPDDRFLVETDCPYLAPIPYRGKQNEPSYVRLTAEKVASVRNISLNRVAELTTQNFFRLFKKARQCSIKLS